MLPSEIGARPRRRFLTRGGFGILCLDPDDDSDVCAGPSAMALPRVPTPRIVEKLEAIWLIEVLKRCRSSVRRRSKRRSHGGLSSTLLKMRWSRSPPATSLSRFASSCRSWSSIFRNEVPSAASMRLRVRVLIFNRAASRSRGTSGHPLCPGDGNGQRFRRRFTLQVRRNGPSRPSRRSPASHQHLIHTQFKTHRTRVSSGSDFVHIALSQATTSLATQHSSRLVACDRALRYPDT